MVREFFAAPDRGAADVNPGTFAQPVRTLAKLASLLTQPGDIGRALGGQTSHSCTYIEALGNFPASGSALGPITLMAGEGEEITWKTPVLNPTSYSGPVIICNRSFIRLEGFHFEDAKTKTVIRAYCTFTDRNLQTMQGLEFVNLHFRNCGNTGLPESSSTSIQIYLQNLGRLRGLEDTVPNQIENCEFDGNKGVAAWLIGSCDCISRNLKINNLHASQYATADPNTNNKPPFIARGVHCGGGSLRNLFEDCQAGPFIFDSYIGSAAISFDGFKTDSGGSNNIFRRLRAFGITDARSSGLFMESGCNENLIEECAVFGIAGGAFVMGSRPTNLNFDNIVRNCVGYDCGVGLALINSKNFLLENTILDKIRATPVFVYTAAARAGGHRFRNNSYSPAQGKLIAVWNGTGVSSTPPNLDPIAWSAASGDVNSHFEEAEFINAEAADFHLTATACCRATGYGGLDMGCYPSDPIPPPPPRVPEAPSIALVEILA